MNNQSAVNQEPEIQLASLVRFTKSQALALIKERLLTGKSIPTILKDSFFKRGATKLVFSSEDARELSKQLSYISRNLNQLTRYIHSGINGTVIEDFQTVFRRVNDLLENVSLEYGNRKNSI